MYLRASEMSKQAWSEAVKTNNLEEHMLLDPLYYSFGDKEQKCWGGASKCWGGCKTCWGGANCVTYCVIHKKQQKAGTFICGGGYKGVGLGACIGIEHNCRIILTLNSKSKTCSLADLGGIGLGSKIIGL